MFGTIFLSCAAVCAIGLTGLFVVAIGKSVIDVLKKK